jgi:subtilisin family serine protease
MNKLWIVLTILIILIPQVTSNELSDKVDIEIIEELKTEETVSVIVVLEDSADLNIGEQNIEIKDNNWRTSDDKIPTEDIEVTYEYSTIMNGFSAEVNEEALEELEQNDNVEKIFYDHIYELALDTSIPLVSADDVHALQLNGINLTGEGQTICVIDTGVNYNHVDLGGCFGSGCKVISGYDFCSDDATCSTNDTDPLDVNGHGTHVSGIAAANGASIGVAPGANIVATKAFNSSGSAFASSITASIDWCVSNASEYNISVISMSLSLGGIVFDSYSECDEYSGDGGVVSACNNAGAQGLLVAAAAGNSGSTSGISLPACGSNVTSVGGVDDSDTVYYNRYSILDLLAPGVNINSTYYTNSDYASMSGTSMATPHVAGASAVLKQIADIEGAEVTVQQIEDALKEHGDLVYDSSSDYTYPRINLLASANYFIYPNFTYSENVVDGSIISPNTETLIFTADDISGISTFWYNSIAGNVYDAYNTSAVDWFVDVNWTEGEYNLTFYVNDSINNLANTSLTLYVDSAPTIDDWQWSNSTDSSAVLTNITINENDTLTVLVNVTDSDVYNNITYNWTLNSVEINTTQNLIYDIGLQGNGVHTLALTVLDELNQSSLQEWNLIVEDVLPPVWSVISNSTADEDTWTYDISSYVNNYDEDTLSYTVSVNLSDFTASSVGIISGDFGCQTSGLYNIYVNVSDGTTIVSSDFYVTVDDTCTSGSGDNEDDDSVFDDGGSGGGGGGGGNSGTANNETTETNATETATESTNDTVTEESFETENTDESTDSADVSDYPLGAFGSGLNGEITANQKGAIVIVVLIIIGAVYVLMSKNTLKKGKNINFGNNLSSIKNKKPVTKFRRN